MILLKKIHRK